MKYDAKSGYTVVRSYPIYKGSRLYGTIPGSTEGKARMSIGKTKPVKSKYYKFEQVNKVQPGK